MVLLVALLMSNKIVSSRPEAHRLQTKKIYEMQRQENERKMVERSIKEKEREAKLELKRLVDAQQAELKRKEAKDRIESNLLAARQHFKEICSLCWKNKLIFFFNLNYIQYYSV